MFFDGDSSSGVSGDLESATAVASFMEGYWGMGHTVSSYSTARRLEVGSPGGGRGGPTKGESTEKVLRAALADRIEDQLADLLTKAEEILKENRVGVLALAHALETHKTLTGEDVEAVLEQRTGISVDGTVYGDSDFIDKLEEYHSAAAGAHVGHTKIDGAMPEGGRLAPPPPPVPEPEPVAASPYAGYGQPQGYGAPAPGNGQGQPGPWQGGPGYGYPPPPAGGAGNGGAGNGAGNGGGPGYPPPVSDWGRPEPGPGADSPTQAYGPGHTGHQGNGNGQAPPDSGETAPAAWYPAEPLYSQPETGPVQIVGEPSAATPPAGGPVVGQPHDVQPHDVQPHDVQPHDVQPQSQGTHAQGTQAQGTQAQGEAEDGPVSRTGHENGQAERGADAESNEDEDRPGRS
jgi:hypothetical protein